MALHQDIFDQLEHYLAGQSSIAAFEEWFFPATWNVHKSGDTAAERLHGPLALHLSEFDRGHWTEEEIREKLREITIANRAPSANMNGTE